MRSKVLHYISVSGVYMFLYGLLYTFQNVSVGWIPLLNIVLFDLFPLKIIVFTIVSIIVIFKFTKVSSPYKDDYLSS